MSDLLASDTSDAVQPARSNGSRTAAVNAIRRRFISVDGRDVHIRYAGQGPAVILIGQSPTSAQILDRHTLAFAKHFTAIAMDTPGLGRSSPLPTPDPEISDQAEALASLLDVLGIEKAAFYGSHTGASIALEFAARFPERTAIALLDGLPIYSDLERNLRLSTYFTEYSETWDGLHLLWLWYRYREQNVFWPWNIRGKGTRGQCDVPPPDHLHRGLVDILEVGMDYVPPYAAAFRHRAETVIGDLQAPVKFLAYPDDSLLPALRHLPSLPDCCGIVEMPDDRSDAIDKEITLLKSVGDWGAADARFPIIDTAGGSTRTYVDLPSGQLAMRRYNAGSRRPLLVLPPVPGSATQLATLPELLARDRDVIVLDAPGCGDSDRFPEAAGDMDLSADLVANAMVKLVDEPFDIYARNGGATIAAILAHLHPTRVGRIVLDNPPLVRKDMRPAISERYGEPIELGWDGSHLIKLWHATRDQELYWPWYERTREAVRDIDPDIHPRHLTTEVHAYLKNHENYAKSWRAVLSYPLLEWLSVSVADIVLCANANALFYDATRSLAGSSFVEMPDGLTVRAERIRALLR